MPVTIMTHSRLLGMLLAVLVLAASLSAAQDTPLSLPDSPESTQEATPESTDLPDEPVLPITPTAGPLAEDPQPTATPDGGLALPDPVETDSTVWRGPRAPQAADPTPFTLGTRAPAGGIDRASAGFDIVGAYPWHQAGYLGAGIRIALMDFGFGTSSNIPAARQPDLTCLNSYPNVAMASGFGAPAAGDSGRGLNMAEIICDIAPQARITLYKITNSARLYDAITAAAANHQVIVIGSEFGASFSPGDGTFGRNEIKNVYAAIANARNAGAVVIVAAGNMRTSYQAFELATSASVNLTLTARPGQTIDISWNDWDGNPHISGGAREDLSATLSGAGFSPQSKPARGSGNPAYQWILPASCTTDLSGYCTATLNVSGLTGNASDVVVQVSVSGPDSSLSTPPTAITAGSLARPADSPDAIAVGAVCANREGSYPELPYSSTGPVYGTGGDAPGLPPQPYPANAVKPDIVSVAQVHTSQTFVNDFTLCLEGFGGTQAAAAHVAGMVALMRQNPINTAFSGVPQPFGNIRNYLRGHAIDLPIDQPNGYDMVTGGGLSVLGRPSYDNDAQFSGIPLFAVPDDLPDGRCTGGVVYAGPYNIGSSMDGSLGAPYTSVAQAAKLQADAGADRCVVVLPGEYVTPFVFSDSTHPNGVGIYGYSSVTTGDYDGSELYINNTYHARFDPIFRNYPAGVVVESRSDFTLSGFVMRGAQAFNTSIQPAPSAVTLDDADNAIIENLSLTDFPSNLGTISLINIVNGSTNAVIANSTFSGITLASSAGIIAIENSGSSSDPVILRDNEFSSITNQQGQWFFPKNPNDAGDGFVIVPFVPVVSTLDSYTRIQNNLFTNNRSEVLIQFLTRSKTSTEQTDILGNAIISNTIQTVEDPGLSGPLIHGFFGPRVYIVNNTIANNTITSPGNFNLLIARGDNIDDSISMPNGPDWNGSLAVEARWEIHNNFIYDNGTAALAGDTDSDYDTVGCTNLADVENAGASHNWLYGRTLPMSGGQCGFSIGNPALNNIQKNPYTLDTNNQPIPADTYILGGDNRSDPSFYTLIGNNTTPPDGVDDGLDSLVTGTFPTFASGLDIRGIDRRVDGDEVGGLHIDIGAFELPGPTFVFRLTGPANGAVLTSAPSVLTWSSADAATSYSFDLKKIDNGVASPLLALANLTPAADADALTCSIGLGCALTLSSAELDLLTNAGGLMRWTVYASDGVASVPAINGPYRFSLPEGTPIPVRNFGFEVAGTTARQAKNWTTAKAQNNDRRICGAGNGANGSNCSFTMTTRPGEVKNIVRQTLKRSSSLNLGVRGDTLTVSFYVRRNNLGPNTGRVTVTVFNPKGKKQVMFVQLPSGGSNAWETTPYTQSMVLKFRPVRLVVSASVQGPAGKYWIDDITLTLK